ILSVKILCNKILPKVGYACFILMRRDQHLFEKSPFMKIFIFIGELCSQVAYLVEAPTLLVCVGDQDYFFSTSKQRSGVCFLASSLARFLARLLSCALFF